MPLCRALDLGEKNCAEDRARNPCMACPPSLFIFSHDCRRIIRTRRGGAARPAQHLPAGSGKRLPGPDGRVNLSGD